MRCAEILSFYGLIHHTRIEDIYDPRVILVHGHQQVRPNYYTLFESICAKAESYNPVLLCITGNPQESSNMVIETNCDFFIAF